MSIDTLINQTVKRIGVKCAPTLVTIIGDSILPRDNKIWMSALIEMAELFHMDSRAVRTSVYRLAKDNWLNAHKQGRKSYYKLTPISTKRFMAVDEHLYNVPLLHTVKWCRVLLLDRKHKNKDKLQQELQWLGFGTLAGGTYIHPNGNSAVVVNLVKLLNMQDCVIVTTGEESSVATAKALRKMGQVCWNLPELEKRSKNFIKTFSPLHQMLQGGETTPPEQAFIIRTIVVHEYRRMMVHYPILPQKLLPADWAWLDAYSLCAHIYKRVLTESETYLDSISNSLPIPMPPAGPNLYNRFPKVS